MEAAQLRAGRVASIVAAALRPYLLGGGVLFPMPESAALAPLGLVLAAVLGIVAGSAPAC